jgi:hypothetical protein
VRYLTRFFLIAAITGGLMMYLWLEIAGGVGCETLPFCHELLNPTRSA